MPKSTCDALAEHLPIRHDGGLGLYTWDTGDSRYSHIINSAAGLFFTLRSRKSVEAIDISVPFRQLHLNLTAPITSSPTPYFPCSTNRANDYVLGRAFLQSAFVGALLDEDGGRWWLAQAPGPSISGATALEIRNSQDTIEGSGGDWQDT